MAAAKPASPATPPAANTFRLWTPAERDASMRAALAHCAPGEDVWIYGYGSLIWRPEFAFAEARRARLYGYHRALCLWSRVNRGTPDCPGLVFGLDRGGACRGMAYRLRAANVAEVFPALWHREMSTGAYLPRWLACDTDAGKIRALVFVMDRSNSGYAGVLPDQDILAIVRRASGRYGPCTDYVLATAQALHAAGIRDARLDAIARGLTAGGSARKRAGMI